MEVFYFYKSDDLIIIEITWHTELGKGIIAGELSEKKV